VITLPRLSILTLILASITLTACSGEAGSAWHGSVRDSAGIKIVNNLGPPLWTETDRWTFSEVLKIGVVEGEPEYMFGQVKGIGVLSDGRIVVNDGMAQHLRFFYPDGKFEKTVGGPGSGPGEFGPGGLTVLVGPGDTLLVVDQANQRANRIAPDGTWLDSWRLTLEDGWLVYGWDDAPTGRLVTHMTRVPGMQRSEADTFDLVVVRDLDGTTGDTLASVPGSRLRQYSAGRMVFYLYAGEPVVSLCPDNSLVAGRGDRYEIRRYDSGGELEQVIRLDRQSAPITESDQTFLRQRFKEIYLESGVTSEQVQDLLSAMHFTETYPAYVTLRCGPRGSIWVQPVKPVSLLSAEEKAEFWVGPDAEAAAYFDVFDHDGKYLGVVTQPPGFWLGRFHGDYAYGRWTDSLDVEHLMVLEVDGLPALDRQ
jgi:hypothetical protein